ncbi:Glycoside hydrolase family 16 protein [Mycena venus]|uniref:Glycoside hydrolase family 16 protein n=1 Tax=Mycena venus TaxID=2733690 RepID=A0A8H7D9Q8_9AGAR|nr:Glycoside hydrolase family 16 protein [Mycena venus]
MLRPFNSLACLSSVTLILAGDVCNMFLILLSLAPSAKVGFVLLALPRCNSFTSARLTLATMSTSHRPSARNAARRPPYGEQTYPYVSTPRPSESQNAHTTASPLRTPDRDGHHRGNTRVGIVQDVARGSIGSGYGPYAYDPILNRADLGRGGPRPMRRGISNPRPQLARTQTVNTQWGKNLDLDDVLHNPDPARDARMDRSCDIFSARGWANATALFFLLGGLIALFAGYPVIVHFTHPEPQITGFNLGGINGTGQVPLLTKFPSLIDPDTPTSAYTYTGTDGKKYDLVFSDEFNVEGRTFYPGDDPYWEAVDLHYWPTQDLEWYDPAAVTTRDGKLVITLSEVNTHDLNFQSGMIASWNKICFTTGYIEVSISLPGAPTQVGFWPGAWTMGNLGRAGYGATTEGMWPYTYASCDLGTFPNQTTHDNSPFSTVTSELSFLPGQRLSACTCPGSDHPGPDTTVGRGVPEIDIIEALVEIDDTAGLDFRGQVSQSYQVAPYNALRQFNNASSATPIQNTTATKFNHYMGDEFQQTVSALTYIDSSFYGGSAYAPYGLEWFSDPSKRESGYISWYSNGAKTWTLTPDTIGPDPTSEVSARLISEEPMYMIFNLGISPSFQGQDFKHMVFPAEMFIDYVRVYQLPGAKNGLTCDPPNYPTSEYINAHIEAYMNPNLTTWAQAGYTFPRNSLYDGC